jgi:hypothetical protein
MGEPADSHSSVDRDESRSETIADALDVLGDMGAWRLAEPRWVQVETILQSLATAITTADFDGLRRATAELELIGPVRITRIGATPIVAPPRRIRDITNHLVHQLTAADRDASSRCTNDGGESSGDRSRTD